MKNLIKKVMILMLVVFTFGNIVTIVYSNSYSNIFLFGKDHDKNREIDEPYGHFQLNIWCPDSFENSLSTLITFGYLNDSLAKAKYIKFVNITVILLDSRGKTKVSKNLPNTRNLLPGENVQYYTKFAPPSEFGTYFLSINFTVVWFMNRTLGSLNFSLLNYSNLNELPETYYGTEHSRITVTTALLVVLILGLVGFGVGYSITRRKRSSLIIGT